MLNTHFKASLLSLSLSISLSLSLRALLLQGRSPRCPVKLLIPRRIRPVHRKTAREQQTPSEYLTVSFSLFCRCYLIHVFSPLLLLKGHCVAVEKKVKLRISVFYNIDEVIQTQKYVFFSMTE